MRAYQSRALWRAIELAATVPLPHIGHGMKTASVAGAMRYADDMGIARNMLLRVRSAVYERSSPGAVDRELTEFVKWWEARDQADWR